MPVEEAKLGENPSAPGGDETFSPDEEVVCSFKPDFVSGSTPKFDCERRTARKSRSSTGATTRRFTRRSWPPGCSAALGFPADRMYVVKSVRCFGCPPDPFVGLQCLNEGETAEKCFPALDYTKYRGLQLRRHRTAVEGRRARNQESPRLGLGRAVENRPLGGWREPARKSMRCGCSRSFSTTGTTNPRTSACSAWTRRRRPKGSFRTAGILSRWCRTSARRSAPTNSISTTGRKHRSGRMRRPALYRCAISLTADRAFPTLAFPKRDGSFSPPVSRNSPPPARRAVRRRACVSFHARIRRKRRGPMGSGFRGEGARHCDRPPCPDSP